MIDLVIEQRRKDLGGFEVGRVLPFHAHRMVGPFIFFDHMGPADFTAGFPRSVDVRPHPHIGLSTVSYLFDGQMTHRDSVGATQVVNPGEVNWMTAGRGITHSERFEDLRAHGGRIHGIQAWVALPNELEETDPAFAHHGPEDLPTIAFEDGLWARLIAGEAFGAKAKVDAKSPLFYVHWALKSGARAQLEARGRPEVTGEDTDVDVVAEVQGTEQLVHSRQDLDAGRCQVAFEGGEVVAEQALLPRFERDFECLAQLT